MIETYKFRLYPTKEQEVLLAKHFGTVRFVYNWALNYSQEQYKKDKTYKGWMSIVVSDEFHQLKRNNPWMKEIGSGSITHSIGHLGRAFDNFFERRAKFPKFKSKKQHKDSFDCPKGVKLDFKHSKIQIPKFISKKGIDNRIKCIFSKKVKQGKIGTATISRNPVGQYFVSFIVHTLEKETPLIDKSNLSKENSFGIDFGLKHFLTLSNGHQIDSPEFFKKTLSKLKLRQRQFSKTKSDSKNHEKMRIKVARIHNKIANQRKDFLHKLSTSIANDSQVSAVCIEDLNLEGMKKLWGRKVGDLSYYAFTQMLEYKLKRRGKHLLKIGKFDPSSQLCSNCGNRQKLTLDKRVYVCPKCGLSIDRDLNASINIRDFAIFRDIRKHSNTAATAGINACGDGSSGSGGANRLNETTVCETRKIERRKRNTLKRNDI